MEAIQKTIVYDGKDKKQRPVFIGNNDSYIINAAFLIIVGLEIYYKNRYEAGGIYLCGLWSYVFGALYLFRYLINRNTQKKLDHILNSEHGKSTMSISFTEDYFYVDVSKCYSYTFYWSTLTGSHDTKKHLSFTLSGNNFFVSKKYFTVDEISKIEELLQANMRQQIK